MVDFDCPTILEGGPADLVAKAKEIWPEIETAKKAIWNDQGAVQHHALTGTL